MATELWPRRAVVTGGAGFLGSHLCERLVDAGAEVVCVDNLVTGTADNVADLAGHPRFELLQADVSESLRIAGEVDLVAHLASPASPVHYQRLALETLRASGPGTINALELATAKRARFLLASTSEVYGDPETHPQPETYWGNVNPIGPRSMYDEGKRYAEALTTAYRHAHGTRTAIARIFNSYGPRLRPDDGRMIPTFIQQALAEVPLTVSGDGRQTRSLCYVDDTVGGLLALAGSEHAGPVNIGGPVELAVRDIAATVIELTGSRSRIRYVAAPVDDPRRRCPDIARAHELLDWAPRVGLAEGLGRTIDYVRARTGQRGGAAA